jgi:uncharacterized phage-associated protein
MKLQKLLYYCQGWHLAWDGEPLFGEEFEAWLSGPVCRELYELHKGEYSVGPGFFYAKLRAIQEVEEDARIQQNERVRHNLTLVLKLVSPVLIALGTVLVVRTYKCQRQ